MASSVFGPGLLIMFSRERVFFAVTDCGNTACFNTKGYDIVLYAVGSPLSKGEVIFIRSSLITMAFHLDYEGRVFHQKGGVFFQNLRISRADIIFVIVKI